MAAILLIEDNVRDANLFKRILTAHGHVVHHAMSALDGLYLAAKVRPDLILLALDLPDLDGRIVASRLKSDSLLKTTPVIAVTARFGQFEKRLAYGYGCDGYIPKPIAVRNFPQLIMHYLKPSALSL